MRLVLTGLNTPISNIPVPAMGLRGVAKKDTSKYETWNEACECVAEELQLHQIPQETVNEIMNALKADDVLKTAVVTCALLSFALASFGMLCLNDALLLQALPPVNFPGTATQKNAFRTKVREMRYFFYDVIIFRV